MRPPILHGATPQLQTPCGHLYATLNSTEEGNLYEVFLNLGKAGGCVGAHMEALGRVISIALQNGVDPKRFADTLLGSNCHQSNEDTYSCINAFAHQLKDYIELQEQKKLVEKEVVK